MFVPFPYIVFTTFFRFQDLKAGVANQVTGIGKTIIV
jgi:hypothetical protein